MKNYGLVEHIHEVTAYYLGGKNVPWIPYNPSGNWENWLPKYENQTTKLGEETSGCTVWASQNQLETLYKFIYGIEPNYSERFTYLQVPVRPGSGANPQDTFETIRKTGLVDDGELPMTDSLLDYLDTSDLTPSLTAKGLNWLQNHEYMHEWLWKERPQNYMDVIKEALETSPIAVSVSAWQEEVDQWGNLVYVSRLPRGNNHLCLLFKFDEQGYPWVFDSYDHSKKRLAKDHLINRAKRIFINKKTRSAMPLHIKILKSVVNRLMNKKTLVDVVTQNLGKDVTPYGVDNEVACAETLSTLLNLAYGNVPLEVSTIKLDRWLSNPQNGFTRVLDPIEGDVIISPTQGTRIGHCGVVMENDLIASNNSFGINKGKLTKNYTLIAWKKYYENQLKLETHYYRKS